MNIIGYDFLGDVNSFLSDRDSDIQVTDITISNGIFDVVKLTKDTEEYNSNTDIKLWTDGTVFISTFDNGDLVGGNLSYFIEDISSIRLKRREVGDFNWTGIYEYIVTDPKNATFTYIDPYARGRNTLYEYCVAPVFRDGTERNYNVIEVKSDFDGAILTDREHIYHIMLEPTINTTTRNKTASVVSTLNNKYPFVFYGSSANYISGSFSGIIIKKADIDYDKEDSIKYRIDFIDWLTNGKPKILKIYDGRMWMINVSGNVQYDCSEHYDKVKISFDFVEIGDVSSTEDMYNNNFVDYIK